MMRDLITNNSARRRHGARAGFTLVEVMVASFISMMLVASLVATVVHLRATMRAQQLIGEMHQNVRFAMDAVSRDIRSAGYGLDVPDALLNDWITWISGLTGNPMVIEGSGGAPDELVILGALDTPVTTLASSAAVDENVIHVVNASDFNLFDKSVIFIGQTTTARIVSINGNALTISLHPTLSRGLEYDHPAGSSVELVQEVRYEWYDAADYPHYPFLSRHDQGKDYPSRWMLVTAGHIEDFQVTPNGDALEVALTGIVAHPDRFYTHPEKGDNLRRETITSIVRPRN